MTAIIAAAGRGTRFSPVTKVIPKEMLPIGSRPALELIVEEAFSAGAEETVIVISPEKEMIRKYFEGDTRIKFAYQKEQLGLGHAILQARTDDDILVLLGDALVFGENVSKKLVEIHEEYQSSVIGLERVDRSLVSRYGVVKPREVSSSVVLIDDIVEKPSAEEAPSNLVVAGRYLLKAKIFDLLAALPPGKNGEIQLTDAISRLINAPGEKVFGRIGNSMRQDIGNPDGYYSALTNYRSTI